VRPPTEAEAKRCAKGQTLISFFYPGQNEALMELAKSKGANVIAMDMVPRISRAQKMDALSSMANIAGYRAVIEAGNNFRPLLHRPGDGGGQGAAGQGAGRRRRRRGPGRHRHLDLARRDHLCLRRAPRSGRADRIDGRRVRLPRVRGRAQDGAATGGYAAPSSPEFREKQLEKFREMAPDMDIVITTALIPNRPAPKLWTKDMVEAMKPGSVIVDLAAERGGNCELTVKDEKIVTDNGVTIIGYTDFPSRMAAQSSTLYATNIRHMMTDLTPEKDGRSCTTWKTT
jgi:NAD(P) transhydrogenase subunit alpha